MSFKLRVRYPELVSSKDYGDLMTVDQFMVDCEMGCLINYDGYGYPVRELHGVKKYAPVQIWPSIRKIIPEDATHILWYNR